MLSSVRQCFLKRRLRAYLKKWKKDSVIQGRPNLRVQRYYNEVENTVELCWEVEHLNDKSVSYERIFYVTSWNTLIQVVTDIEDEIAKL